jgi:hypothetical protein
MGMILDEVLTSLAQGTVVHVMKPCEKVGLIMEV